MRIVAKAATVRRSARERPIWPCRMQISADATADLFEHLNHSIEANRVPSGYPFDTV
jgi:hypothetical protein